MVRADDRRQHARARGPTRRLLARPRSTTPGSATAVAERTARRGHRVHTVAPSRRRAHRDRRRIRGRPRTTRADRRELIDRSPRPRRRPRGHRRLLAARHVRRPAPGSSEPRHRCVHRSCVWSKPWPSTTPSSPACTSSPPTRNRHPAATSAGRRPGRHLGPRPGHRPPGVRRTLGRSRSTSTTPTTARQTAARICEHLLDGGSEDQIAIRGDATFVPRLRPCTGLTQTVPHQAHRRRDLRRHRRSRSARPRRGDLPRRTRRAAHHAAGPQRRPTAEPLVGADRRRPPLRDRRRRSGRSNVSVSRSPPPASMSPTPTRWRTGCATTSETAAGRSAESSTPRDRCHDQLLVNMSERRLRRR